MFTAGLQPGDRKLSVSNPRRSHTHDAYCIYNHIYNEDSGDDDGGSDDDVNIDE